MNRMYGLLLISCYFINACSSTHRSKANDVAPGNTLPKGGKLIDDKPVGKGWIDLVSSLDEWNAAKPPWSLDNGVLHGDYNGGKLHNYAYTKTVYTNYELNAVVRMSGREANSGVCIRIHPTDADNVPGYQVDMGPGYWGCLWEERRAGMVQQYPKEKADKLVKDNDWNHYYIIAKGHHIEAWLNGVKTIDTIHAAGFIDGAIGIQLCHGDKHTIVDVKTLSIRRIN
ncbi:MAG: DUF1080 domain-containing protein [Ginsengibacter sp.]